MADTPVIKPEAILDIFFAVAENALGEAQLLRPQALDLSVPRR